MGHVLADTQYAIGLVFFEPLFEFVQIFLTICFFPVEDGNQVLFSDIEVFRVKGGAAFKIGGTLENFGDDHAESLVAPVLQFFDQFDHVTVVVYFHAMQVGI